MSLKHTVARLFVRCLPSEAGLWRLQSVLPNCPRQYSSDGTCVTKLRGYNLVLKFKPTSYVGWHLFYRGMYEDTNVRMCSRLLRPGMTFVDVGANYGLYTIVAAAAVGPNGRVVAFEPQADLAALVSENAKNNKLANVTVKAFALGIAPGNATLYQTSRTNDGAAALRVSVDERIFGKAVPVVVDSLSHVLDEWGGSSVDGMKIDVEGAELSVLKGAVSLLAKKQPEFILLECIDSHLRRFAASSEELLAFLWEFGYRSYCLFRGRWRHVSAYADYERCHASPDILAVHPSTATWERLVTTTRLK